MSRAFLLILAFFACLPLIATQGDLKPQPDNLPFSKKLENGFIAIYNYKFEEALAITNGLKKTDPNNPRTYLLEANYWWWKILSGEDTEGNYIKMEGCLDKAMSKIPKRKAKEYNDEELYNIINVYAYRSRIKLLQEKYIKGAQNLNTCIDFVEASFGKENRYELFKLTSGLYYYFVDYGYENYFLARAYLIFLPSGDKEKGLKFLKESAKSKDILVRTEACYFLMRTYCELEENYVEALNYLEPLTKLYPDNLLYRYHHCRILLFMNKKELALKQFNLLQEAKEKGKKHAEHFVSLAQEDLNTFNAKGE